MHIFNICIYIYIYRTSFYPINNHDVCLPSLKKNTFIIFLLPASIFFKFKLPSLNYHFRSHTYLEFLLLIK